MKLLNFYNLEFKWEYKKEMRFHAYCIDFKYKYKFKYWFYYPASYYFSDDIKIKKWKANYQKYFIDIFKLLKKDITNETS